jgi:hypothetical protein
VDTAHLALVHQRHQTGLDEALDVVVDALRCLPELLGHLTTGVRLGEPAQHLDPLRLEQCLGLLELLQMHHVSHHTKKFVHKNLVCQWSGLHHSGM